MKHVTSVERLAPLHPGPPTYIARCLTCGTRSDPCSGGAALDWADDHHIENDTPEDAA